MRARTFLVLMALCLSSATVVFAAGGSEQTGAGSGNINPAGAFPIAKNQVTLSAFVAQWSWVSNLDDNEFRKYVEKKTNLKLALTVVPGDALTEKRQLLLASGDYPEVFMTGNFSNAELMQYGLNEKVLIPLNDLIKSYCVEITGLMAKKPFFKQDITAPDGNIYGIPSFNERVHGASSNKMWVNVTWLKKLGIAKPENTAQFRNMLVAFKTKDPNGNGKADEVPLSGAIKTWAADPYWFLMDAFALVDSGKQYLILQNKKLDTVVNKPEFRDGLRYVAGLYREGLIDPAGFTQTLEQLQQLGNNQTMILGAFGAGHLAMGIDANGPRARDYDGLAPIAGPTGFRQTPYSTPGRVSGAVFAITNKCKNPEAAIRLADFMMSEEGSFWGDYGLPEAKAWEPAKSGQLNEYGTQAKYSLTPNTATERGAAPRKLSWSMTSLLNYAKETIGLVAVNPDIYSPESYEYRLSKNMMDNYYPYRQKTDEIPPLWAEKDVFAKLAQLQTPLMDYIQSAMVEFITGKRNIDTDWDAYLRDLEKLKGPEFIQTYQAALDKSMAGK